MPYEVIWGDDSTSQGMTEAASKSPEARERGMEQIHSHRAQRETVLLTP